MKITNTKGLFSVKDSDGCITYVVAESFAAAVYAWCIDSEESANVDPHVTSDDIVSIDRVCFPMDLVLS